MIGNFFKHFAMIIKHKNKVLKNCFKCGLFWRGIVHDLSKFSFAEFWEGVKYYSGNRSPISKCREENGYSYAWIHHKNRNKHHIEYWFDAENKEQMIMPYKYAVECVCDKIAATKCYMGKNYKPEMVLKHWQKFGSLFPANENVKIFFEKVFTDLITLGEKAVFNKKYMKNTYNYIVLKTD